MEIFAGDFDSVSKIIDKSEAEIKKFLFNSHCMHDYIFNEGGLMFSGLVDSLPSKIIVLGTPQELKNLLAEKRIYKNV